MFISLGISFHFEIDTNTSIQRNNQLRAISSIVFKSYELIVMQLLAVIPFTFFFCMRLQYRQQRIVKNSHKYSHSAVKFLSPAIFQNHRDSLSLAHARGSSHGEHGLYFTRTHIYMHPTDIDLSAPIINGISSSYPSISAVVDRLSVGSLAIAKILSSRSFSSDQHARICFEYNLERVIFHFIQSKTRFINFISDNETFFFNL